MIRLKRCPFCGGKAEILRCDDDYAIICERACDVGPVTNWEPSLEYATELWNTRPLVVEEDLIDEED